jgi:hypothetical protein
MTLQDTPKRTRSEQARLNGAKSKGPITPNGKTRSSKNALKHGFAAVINNVLGIEDEAAFNLHLDGLRASFLPQNYAEHMLVDQLASISWRQSRLIGLETALIDAQMDLQEENIGDLHPVSAGDPYFKLVLAWQALARQPQRSQVLVDPNTAPIDPTIPPEAFDIGSLELVRRYLTSLDRQFRNVLLNLRQYRKDFAIAPASAAAAPLPVAAPNEPETPQEQPANIGESIHAVPSNNPKPGPPPQHPGLAIASPSVKPTGRSGGNDPETPEVAA